MVYIFNTSYHSLYNSAKNLSEGVVEDGGIEVDVPVGKKAVHDSVSNQFLGSARDHLAIGGDELEFIGEQEGL